MTRTLFTLDGPMFPLGQITGLLQAAREAETDVYILIVAARQLPDRFPLTVMKYVAVASLAFVDTVSTLAGLFIKQHSKRVDADQLATIIASKKAFERARNAIEKRLRDYVRNLVSAHRSQQTVESVRNTHLVLVDPNFPSLFDAARVLVDAMEDAPVWTWGRSAEAGIVGMRCSKVESRKPSPRGSDGFEVRVGDRSASIDLAEEVEFNGVVEATIWADL